MRVLSAVIEPLMLAMLDPWQQFGFGRAVALQLVGDEDPRGVLQPQFL